MSQRKLQQEIDKVFKKVKEGLEVFENTYIKLERCESSSLKDKFEGDLKREIKKLQRQRDQIKTWLSGNDVKDKKPLLEHRKLIENAMEKFKVVEKNMKTKAFSKEGLSMDRLDPREREKNEMSEFIHQMLEELERQIEKNEAEIDQLQNSTKKGRKLDNAKQSQVNELQERVDRSHWHEEKLEQILRLIANDELECDQVAEIQEDIRYYVESNEDNDFIEDETIYDELNLDEAEEAYGNIGDFPQAQHAGEEHDTPTAHTPKKTFAPQPPPLNTTTTATTLTSSTNIPKSTITTPIQSIGATNLKPAVAPKAELKYSSVIAAVSSSAQSTPSASTAQLLSSLDANELEHKTPIPSAATLTKTISNTTSEDKTSSRESTLSPKVDKKRTLMTNKSIVLQDLLPHFEKLKQNIHRPQSLDEISKLLENSLLNCPDSLDSERTKIYTPKHPLATSIHYPQEPLIELSYPSLIRKLDLSTLFYNFYYHQGEYVQLASAQELVKRNWEYDVISSKWFQRTEEIQPPSFVNDKLVSSEKKIIWKYFDYEAAWLPRRKDDFDLNSVELRTAF